MFCVSEFSLKMIFLTEESQQMYHKAKVILALQGQLSVN